MGKSSKRVYTAEFKTQASRLAMEIGTRRAAEQLGVSMSGLAKWKKSEVSLDPKTKKKEIDFECEYKRLMAENAEQRKVITILKAAAAFFSRDHL